MNELLNRNDYLKRVEEGLRRQVVVAVLGPRQVGKTTLAQSIAEKRPSLYLDLERDKNRSALESPQLFFDQNKDKLVILDEIHMMPNIYQEMRGIVDDRRREGRRYGQFLILGSAGIDLLKQSGETLAGRIEYVDLVPFQLAEILDDYSREQLWVRGGFPEAFLAESDSDSLYYRRDFIRTYLQRDIPTFSGLVAAETLERLWTILAHNQGQLLNTSKLASSLGVSAPTVSRYVDLFVDLLLIRRLRPFSRNLQKRLVKSPKTYIRDSGLLHALLGIEGFNDMMRHPVLGASWEGFVIETLINAAPEGTRPYFYRSHGGAEVDLILEIGRSHGTWAIEIKHGLAPRLSRGNHEAFKTVQADKNFVIYSGERDYPISETINVVSLSTMSQKLRDLGN